jgi:hypothetical protein
MSNYPITDYVIGVDLGRDRDHSAFAVLAIREVESGSFDHARLCRPLRRLLQLGALQRIPLGTEYLEVIRQLRQIITRLQTNAGWGAAKVHVHVVIDSAGPGQIAIELIRAQRLDINFVPALLTAGHEIGYSQSGKVTVPRRELITHLRYLLEVQSLRVHSALAHGRHLEDEVAAVRPHGGQYEHDDLVIAAGLAAWHATRVYPDIIRSRQAA